MNKTNLKHFISKHNFIAINSFLLIGQLSLVYFTRNIRYESFNYLVLGLLVLSLFANWIIYRFLHYANSLQTWSYILRNSFVLLSSEIFALIYFSSRGSTLYLLLILAYLIYSLNIFFTSILKSNHLYGHIHSLFAIFITYNTALSLNEFMNWSFITIIVFVLLTLFFNNLIWFWNNKINDVILFMASNSLLFLVVLNTLFWNQYLYFDIFKSSISLASILLLTLTYGMGGIIWHTYYQQINKRILSEYLAILVIIFATAIYIIK